MIDAVFKPYVLRFKKPFTISHGTRDHTDTVLIRLVHHSKVGFGECTLPPYLKETTSSVLNFLERSKPLLERSSFDTDPVLVIKAIQGFETGNTAAKAGLEMALWDLLGKLKEQPTGFLIGVGKKEPYCTYTLGVASEKEMLNSINDAEQFKILKIKLNGKDDMARIRFVKENSSKRIMVDVNGGWNDKSAALELILRMHESGVELVEQPFSRMDYEKSLWLTERSPIPVIGDESIQDLNDLNLHAACFHGVNIKLMKCGGLLNAMELMKAATKQNKKILLGCMSESTCGVAAANQLASHADWVDLDGPLLIANDPFKGVYYKDGKLKCENTAGNSVACDLEADFWK